ncbi:MAG: GAF domain-containing protein [Chloroflexi bacterium]|nr:GAF domain-containing protein [Chloroflexota bacterium]
MAHPLSLPASARANTAALAPDWVELLYEVTRQFASSLELDDVLGKVLRLTVLAVKADAGSIFLLDSGGRVIRSILARGDLPPDIKRPLVLTTMTKGFAGWVYQRREAGIIADTAADGRWHFFPDDAIVTRSAIGVPLIRRDIVIGVMTLMHPERNWFNQRQLKLLEAIAAQAASAIENAALYTNASNERSTLQAIIAGARDNVIVTDLKDMLLLVNPMAQRSLGLSEQEVGRPLIEALKEPALAEFYNAAGNAEQALREVRFDDGRVFDCALARVPNVGKVLTMHEITPLKQLDALKSEFVSHVAHDLNAPLGVIQGYTWLLKEDPALNDEAHSYVQQIADSITRMRGLIDNILDIGRIEMGIQNEFQPVSIASVVHESIKNMQALASGKQIALTARVAPATPPVNGSALRLGQAVANLVGNALKFTPPGGTVTVHASLEAGQVTVKVIDSGPGIPPHLQAKLFQKFSRLGQGATQKNEGHGLGLAIVKSVAEVHGGRVWVESQQGKGSTFAFSLPPMTAPPASSAS